MSSFKDSLGDRMKEYERRNQYWLQKRTPVCIRVDMRAGHTFTKGFNRPFDEIFGNAMAKTMEYMATNIQGVQFAYCQSDEITLLLQDYKTFETSAWFDYRTDKLCSIAASMATMVFNKYFAEEVNRWGYEHATIVGKMETKEIQSIYETYKHSIEKGAMFDARCFNIPKEEAANLIYWRQVDAMRNSIQMIGQANYSHSYLQDKSCEQIKMLLRCDFGINWDGLPARWKYGCAWTKSTGLDYNMPVIKGENRAYVENEVYCEEE